MAELKNILLGVTGGIAAYKAADIVSRLKKAGYDVRCMMTASATEIITPLTLQTLSGHPVITELFEEPKEWNVEHISLAQWADVLMIAPATANIIGKVSQGIADDFLSTCVMAASCPIIFAPAMNSQMYLNPLVQRNIASLKSFGYEFIDPVNGNLACGDHGIGKMADPVDIVAFVQRMNKQDLQGINLMVTAGPTREAIDPVRFLTNHSSGKMGYALAQRAQQRGAMVTLISGPTTLTPPVGVNVVPIISAREMFEAVQQHYDKQAVVIKAAAVADYRPQQVSTDKIKKQDGDWHLTLERNPDILAYLGEHKGRKILVGFAAETNDVEENALKKLLKKNLDLIVANDLTHQEAGFGVDTNKVTIFSQDGQVERLPVLSKWAVADHILDRVKGLLD